MTLLDLIEKAKTRANITSDYALAKVMGVDRRYVSLWKKGKKHPSTDEAVKLATLAGIEEMRVIAEIEMQTAKNEQKREFWKCYLEERGIAAALCIVVLGLSIMLTPTPSSAGILQLQNYGAHYHAHNQPEIYIMRILKNDKLLIVKALLFMLWFGRSWLNTPHNKTKPIPAY